MPNAPVYAKVGRPKRTSLQKAQRLVMSKIAKSVVQKTAETKSALGTWDRTCVDDLLYGQNLCYSISQGDTNQNRLGQKIHINNFYIKGKLIAVNNATVGNGTTVHRVMLIKTDQQLTPTNGQFASVDTIFRGSLTTLADRGFIDRYKNHVLYDKTFTQKTAISNANQHINFVINQKINKTVTYTSNLASYFKDEQYYLIVTSRKTDGTVGTCGFMNVQWGVQFKDL